jgi:hypothetical protein
VTHLALTGWGCYIIYVKDVQRNNLYLTLLFSKPMNFIGTNIKKKKKYKEKDTSFLL